PGPVSRRAPVASRATRSATRPGSPAGVPWGDSGAEACIPAEPRAEPSVAAASTVLPRRRGPRTRAARGTGLMGRCRASGVDPGAVLRTAPPGEGSWPGAGSHGEDTGAARGADE